ncbi:MAG: UPF0149 family protein [Pseudomonadales bacterium]
MAVLITYEQLSARLQTLQIPVSADALHGALTGLACSGQLPEQPAWLQQLSDCLDDIDLSEHAPMLSALQTWVQGELADGDLSFQLLLPDSEEFLSVRTRALAQWSDSFLYAFIASGVELTVEDRELMEDMAAISQVDDGEAEDGAEKNISALNNPEDAENNERDFFELCEYVRMAAMDLYREYGNLTTNNVDTQGETK